MVYLIYGEQYPIIKKRLKKIIKESLGDDINEVNLVYVNMEETLAQDLVFEVGTLPLGYDKKVVVAINPFFLSNSKEKCSIENQEKYDTLIKYIESPLCEVDLVFFLEGKTLNTKCPLYKPLQDHAKIIFEQGISKENLSSSGALLIQKFGSNITRDALDELINRTGDNIANFMNEAEKISLYTKNITIEDVESLVSAPLEQNAFNIADSLIKGKPNLALKTYRDLKVYNEEPIRLISLMASQFRVLLEVAYLSGYKEMAQDSIAKELGIHPYRVKLACNNLIRINYYQVQKIIDRLYKMDLDIKKGKVDGDFAIEMFIIEFEKIKRL